MLLALVTQCAPVFYNNLNTGTLHGSILVQWTDKDAFFFRPIPDNPFQFTRYNSEVITPGTMRTDGGSIPRPLRAIKNYSPWGYGPAFIVHDWLFWMHYCKIPDPGHHDVDSAAMVMAEIIKTLMEKDQQIDKFTLYSMYEAVKSPFAQQAWNDGQCKPVPPLGGQGIMQEVIREPVKVLYEYPLSF